MDLRTRRAFLVQGAASALAMAAHAQVPQTTATPDAPPAFGTAPAVGPSISPADPEHPPQVFTPSRRVPHGVTLIGKLFAEGTIVQAGIALEKTLGVMSEHPQL